MKSIHTFLTFICITLNVVVAQQAKIDQAALYYAQFRYADASMIYQELINKDKIDINSHKEIYLKGYESAIQSRNYWEAEKILDALQKNDPTNPDLTYEYLQLNLFLGRYEKWEDLENELSKINFNKGQQTFIQAYKKSKPYKETQTDSSGAIIQMQAFNSGKGDFSPIIVDNQLIFASRRNDFTKTATLDNGNYIDHFQIQLQTKTSKASPFSALISKENDGTCIFDAHSNTWIFSKNLKEKAANQLLTTGLFFYNVSTKVTTAFPYNSSAYFIAHPALSADGKTLYFSSNMEGGFGKADIWKSTLKDGNWTKPENLGPTVNGFENEMFPTLYESTLYFSSNGKMGYGGLDVYKWDGQNTCEHLPYPLNSYGDDFGLFFTEKNKGYYTSNRHDYRFIDNIYTFELIEQEIELILTFKENLPEKERLKNINVEISGKQSTNITTDENGQLKLNVKKGETLNITVNDENYEVKTESIIIPEQAKNVERDVLLDPKYMELVLTVKDKTNSTLLTNVNVSIGNQSETNTSQTNEKGQIIQKIARKSSYELLGTLKGYIDANDSLSTHTTAKRIEKTLLLDKIKAGTSFKIENVFYDFGKATLRPESKTELDKLAEFLLKNDNIKVELSSHTDSRGGDKANQKLSQARAQSCVDYLLTKGIKKTNIVAKGYGEQKLLNKCKNGINCTEEEHQANRRTEIKILSVSPL